MPLTETEAQELIAEIKNNRWEQRCNDGSVFSGAIIAVEKLEKIINRFANRPPFITEIDGGYVTFAIGEYGNHCCIATEWSDHSGRISRAITAPQIKELISNANKMLGYLQDE